MKLAWDCRVRLPLLVTIGFMLLDVRMQLDINIENTRIPRPPIADVEEEETDDSDETEDTNTNRNDEDTIVNG